MNCNQEQSHKFKKYSKSFTRSEKQSNCIQEPMMSNYVKGEHETLSIRKHSFYKGASRSAFFIQRNTQGKTITAKINFLYKRQSK